MKKLISTFLAVGILTSVSLAAASSAHAGGILTDVLVRPWSPALADAADGVSREVQNRTSDAGVGHQILCGLNCLGANNPIGAPAQVGAGPNVAMGNRCVTYRGWMSGPYNPVGSPCHVDGPWGSDPGTVMQ
jgi:hypothetical protein